MARKETVKQMDKVIEATYREHCNGMQINIMLIPALFRMARSMRAKGAHTDTMGAAMVAFVNGAASVKGAVKGSV